MPASKAWASCVESTCKDLAHLSLQCKRTISQQKSCIGREDADKVLRKGGILASDGGHINLLKGLATRMIAIAYDTSEDNKSRVRIHCPAGNCRQVASATCT